MELLASFGALPNERRESAKGGLIEGGDGDGRNEERPG